MRHGRRYACELIMSVWRPEMAAIFLCIATCVTILVKLIDR